MFFPFFYRTCSFDLSDTNLLNGYSIFFTSFFLDSIHEWTVCGVCSYGRHVFVVHGLVSRQGLTPSCVSSCHHQHNNNTSLCLSHFPTKSPITHSKSHQAGWRASITHGSLWKEIHSYLHTFHSVSLLIASPPVNHEISSISTDVLHTGIQLVTGQ